MELHALTGQLYFVNGVEQDGSDVPGLLAMPSPSKAVHGRQNEVLFVHLTLSGPTGETGDVMRDQLLQVADHYFASIGSVTAALRKVIQDTNNWLLNLNLQPGSQAREGAITCAVQRENELFIVQTGESLALIGRNYGVERMPAHHPEHITPLGQSAGIDFRYYHQRLQPGNMLLLADPRIAHMPSHTLAPALVDTELELGLEELREAMGSDSGRLLLVEFTDEPMGATTTTIKPQVSRGRITLPLGLGRRANRDTVTVPAQPVREQASASPSEFADELEALDLSELSESVGDSARQAASSSAAGLSRATGWTADAMERLRPPAKERPDGPHWAVPAIMAVIIPILVALIVSSVYMQRGRVRQVTQIRQAMSESLVLAQESAAEPETARLYYEQILALADEAEVLRPGDAGVAEIRRMALLAIDELDGVAGLSARSLYSFSSGADLQAVAIRDDFTGGIFVLDGENSTTYMIDTDEGYEEVLSEEAEELSFSGQSIGTHVVQDLVDIMWRASGVQVERDGLAMLDAAGALVTYFPTSGDVRSAPLGLSSEWQDPNAIAQFSERIYVLDPPADTIWKYFPQDEGFIVDQGERTLFLSDEIDLRAATDIDIYSEDGSLLVTYLDGTVHYIDTSTGSTIWDESDLLESGLAAPLESPVAGKFVGRGLNASVFILDAGSGRIIQASRLGNVLAQYRATDSRGQDIVSDASDLAVAETPLRIFITNGSQVYVASQEP